MTDLLSGIIIVVTVGAAFALVYVLRLRARLNSGDPTIWERDIRKYEKQDVESPPSEGAILFIGSSSIRYWKTLSTDMAPLYVLNRGFGGSQISEVNHYVDRIVFPYKPQSIVFYAGENDLSGLFYTKKKTPEEVQNDFRTFCEKVQTQLPKVPIYFISIKPPKRRKNLWPEMQNANKLVEEFCNSDDLLHYIDIVPPMLDSESNPRKDLFRWDGIHMNALGYEIWTSIVRDFLL
ncbi:MAG: GDSL-type esterase/lipase family protein [Candidatus Thorarchaeota archaeon]|jgi:lysophospholipase L1-like esterase